MRHQSVGTEKGGLLVRSVIERRPDAELQKMYVADISSVIGGGSRQCNDPMQTPV